MQITRYAIYFVPTGAWGDAGATWLGWDNRSGTSLALDSAQQSLTNRPRKYGFHATIKAPFKLATGASPDAVVQALQRLSAAQAPIPLSSLGIARIGRFFALTAPQENPALQTLAAQVVKQLDDFRAPLSAADIARRRASRLTAEQDALLLKWGYPYVLDAFRFHITLTGPTDDTAATRTAMDAHFAAALDARLTLDSLSVVGERTDGMFQEIARCALSG